MFNFGRRIVTVTFLDETSGTIISSSRMPLDRLPETFAAEIELRMDGANYLVVSAEPSTKAEFSASKQVKVVLRKHRSPP
jgi:hypothetical protein